MFRSAKYGVIGTVQNRITPVSFCHERQVEGREQRVWVGRTIDPSWKHLVYMAEYERCRAKGYSPLCGYVRSDVSRDRPRQHRLAGVTGYHAGAMRV